MSPTQGSAARRKALRRSYLIRTLCNMFPELKIREPEEETEASAILTPESGIDYLLEGLWTRTKVAYPESTCEVVSRVGTYHAKALPAASLHYSGSRSEKELRAPYKNWRTVSQGWSSLRSAFTHDHHRLGLSQQEVGVLVDRKISIMTRCGILRSASAGLRIPGMICPNRCARRGLRRA